MSLRNLLALLPLLACNPTTTRPPFSPHPPAPFAMVDAPPAAVTRAAAEWLAAKGLRVTQVSERDAFVETAWHDTRAGRPVPGGGFRGGALSTVRVRVWSDPGPPGTTRATVEAVYRPLRDPSRPARDLEALVPAEHPGARLAQELLDELVKRFGVPPQYR